jgi:hypothetical protein
MKPQIHLRKGTVLSTRYTNSRDCFKMVETDHVLGYIVSGGGREAAATIYPLYRADVHIKAGKTWHIVSSYEQGDRMTGYTFHEDYEGCTFSTIAFQAINALENRSINAKAAAEERKREAATKKRATKKRATHTKVK